MQSKHEVVAGVPYVLDKDPLSEGKPTRAPGKSRQEL